MPVCKSALSLSAEKQVPLIEDEPIYDEIGPVQSRLTPKYISSTYMTPVPPLPPRNYPLHGRVSGTGRSRNVSRHDVRPPALPPDAVGMMSSRRTSSQRRGSGIPQVFVLFLAYNVDSLAKNQFQEKLIKGVSDVRFIFKFPKEA